jgi:hypothetical protein
MPDDKVFWILNCIATKGDGKLTRRAVKDGGFSRGDYEKLRDALKDQGYIDPYTIDGRSDQWTAKGESLIKQIRETDWKPAQSRYGIVVK